jgi:hypothetical protein
VRNLIIAASAIAFASSAAQAQPSTSFPPEMDEEIVRNLPPPEAVEDMAHSVGRTADAVLNVPIGGVVRAIDPTSRTHPNETLGDLAHRDDPYARERMQDSIGGLAAGMGDMMSRIAVVAPALRRSLADLEQNLDRAMREAPRDRRYDRDNRR